MKFLRTTAVTTISDGLPATIFPSLCGDSRLAQSFLRLRDPKFHRRLRNCLRFVSSEKHQGCECAPPRYRLSIRANGSCDSDDFPARRGIQMQPEPPLQFAKLHCTQSRIASRLEYSCFGTCRDRVQ